MTTFTTSEPGALEKTTVDLSSEEMKALKIMHENVGYSRIAFKDGPPFESLCKKGLVSKYSGSGSPDIYEISETGLWVQGCIDQPCK